MSISQINFIKDLVDQFPELQPLFHEHLTDYGELLPHVFLSTVAQTMTDESKNAQKSYAAAFPTKDILDFVEQRFGIGVEDLDELISVSFVELFSPYVAADAELVRALPPKLAGESSKIYSKQG